MRSAVTAVVACKMSYALLRLCWEIEEGEMPLIFLEDYHS